MDLVCRSLSHQNRWTISRTLTEFKKHGRKHRTTAAKVTAELNQHLNSPFPIKTVHRELIKVGFHGRSTIRKPLLSFVNIQKMLLCCRDHKGWSADQWKHVVFFEEASFSPYPTARWVYMWRQPKEAYNSDCHPDCTEVDPRSFVAAILWIFFSVPSSRCIVTQRSSIHIALLQ